MRVVVSAGGTGGHIYPALAIIHKIKEMEPNSEFLYIGTCDRMEKDIIPQENIPYVGIPMQGLNRKQIWKNGRVLACLWQSVKRAKEEINKFHPDIVLGIGGYITLPVIYAAKKLGYKTFIHEQNAIPGLSNKILAHYADIIGVSLPDTASFFPKGKVYVTGNPRSEEVYTVHPGRKEKYGLTKEKKMVMIVMGSLGSQTITNRLQQMIPSFFKKPYEVLLVTGKDYYDAYQKIQVPQNVKIVPFLNDMPEMLQVCDLIVSRAGASTISEITALGVVSILVPSPYVTHNHQYKNALSLSSKGGALLLEEAQFDQEHLLPMIDSLFMDPKKYQNIKEEAKKLGIRDSATKIYHLLQKLVSDK